ncbi:hypothetical protein GCM10023192_22740 [Amycolatopsis samaneae]
MDIQGRDAPPRLPDRFPIPARTGNNLPVPFPRPAVSPGRVPPSGPSCPFLSTRPTFRRRSLTAHFSPGDAMPLASRRLLRQDGDIVDTAIDTPDQ